MDPMEIANSVLTMVDGMSEQEQKDFNNKIFGGIGEAFGRSGTPLDDNLGENVLAQHMRWAAENLVAGIARGRAEDTGGEQPE